MDYLIELKLLLEAAFAHHDEPPTAILVKFDLLDKIIGEVDGYRRSFKPATIKLTARRCQVLELLAVGDNNTEIGKKLGIKPDTVSSHIGQLKEKLGARNRCHLAAMATLFGLLRSRDETRSDSEPGVSDRTL